MRTPKEPTSVERSRGLETGNYDPAKDDFIHGRLALNLWGDFRDVKTAGCCEGCVFGQGYSHAAWCETPAAKHQRATQVESEPYFPVNVISRPEALL
jgi:hypothetical protein